MENEKKTSRCLSFASLQVVNDHLLKDLTELGLWNPDMKNRLMYENGSIQVRLSPDDQSCFTVLSLFCRTSKRFLITSKLCTRPSGKSLRKRLSTWLRIAVHSSINLNR